MCHSLAVYKFGGTSVGSVAGFLRIREILWRDAPQFVVVSALSGVTDLLEAFCSAQAGKEREGIIDKLIEKHEVIIYALHLAVSLQPWVLKLQRYASISRLSQDMQADILSLGEDIAVYLLQQFCHRDSFPVLLLEARHLIKTDHQYCQATPLLEEIRVQWQRMNLSPHVCYIMQGFVGSNSCGQTTILGRGGSDYSAALLAEVVQAKEVRIYTDVQGVYTMDPNCFSDAQPISFLTFKDMYRLAVCGAKVVNPLMIGPCMRAGIPIFVTSTFDVEERGTWIFSFSEGLNAVK